MNGMLLMRAAVLVAAVGAVSSAQLGLIGDTEPGNNDLFGTPDGAGLTAFESGVRLGFGTLTPGDVDWYRLEIGGGEVAGFIITVPLGADFQSPATQVHAFGGDEGQIFFSNTSAGSDFPGGGASKGSIIRVLPRPGATWVSLGVQGRSAEDAGPYAVLIGRAFTGAAVTNYAEVEPNDVAAAAHVLGNRHAGPTIGQASIATTGDVDQFPIDLNEGDVLVAMTMADHNFFEFSRPDTTLAVTTEAGMVMVVSDDDGGSHNGVDDKLPGGAANRGSAVRFRAPGTGRYVVRVTGATTGTYKLITALIPAAVVPAFPFCDGDADGNGVVNFADITRVLTVFGGVCR